MFKGVFHVESRYLKAMLYFNEISRYFKNENKELAKQEIHMTGDGRDVLLDMNFVVT